MKTVIILSFFVALLHAKVYEMGIRNVGSRIARMIKEGTHQQYLEELYKARAKTTGSQPILDYNDDFYLGNITLGVPIQTFSVLIDTGSSNLWVIDLSCATKACNGPPYTQFNRTKYDTSISATYEADVEKFYLQYGNGGIRGHLAVDILRFGGLSVERQIWGLATSVDEPIGKMPIDGIFGMGWPSIAADHVLPPMQNVLEQLELPLFTVWFDRRVKPDHGSSAGQITYGAFDSKHCEPVINYVMLTSLTYWQFEMDGFHVKNYNWQKKQQAISDTGTSWIGGPQDQIADIALYVGASWNLKHAVYEVDCEKQPNMPDVIFYITGVPFTIPSIEYVMDIGLDNGKCAISFFVIEGGGFGPTWILGDTFIRTYCNIYDIGMQRLGLAKAIHTQDKQ